jgi:hypothetical protein
MKTILKRYLFDPINRTIAILDPDIGEVTLEHVLLITNVTANVIIYNPFVTGSYCTISNNILTLHYDTTAMSVSDKIQIFLDVNVSTQEEQESLEMQYTYDIAMQRVFGSNPITDEQGRLTAKTINPILKDVVGKLYATNHMINIDTLDSQQVIVQLRPADGQSLSAITIQFEVTVDGANWVAIDGRCITATNTIFGQYWDTSTYGSGISIWNFKTGGFKQFRARMTGITSGVVDVLLRTSSAPWSWMAWNNRRGYSGEMPVSESNMGSNTNSGIGQLSSNPVTYSIPSTPAPNGTPVFPAGISSNPGQPSGFVNPVFYKFPQRLQRMRVQSGGDQMLPFAQRPHTLELKVVDDDLYRLVEEMLMHIKMLNTNFANINNINLPKGMENELK